MFVLTLTVPFLWVLPMFHDCCKSQFLEQTTATVFIRKDVRYTRSFIFPSSLQVQSLYDEIDMLLESLIFVPTIFIFNCIATCVLNYRYWKCIKSRSVRPSGVLDDLGRNGLLKMPTVGWIRDQNESEEQVYLRIEVRANERRGY
jgi:hypothetical protein